MAHPETLQKGDFNLSGSTVNEESVIGTYQVDEDSVMFCDLGKPIVYALTTVQTVTVSANSTETKALDPGAPQVPYMDDPVADGDFTKYAYLVAYYDSTGDGSKDTLVTDSTAVSIDGFTEDGDFVREVTLTDTTGTQQDVDIYTITRTGFGKIRRRDKGAQTVTDQLIREDSVRWAFSDPHDRDRQKRWGDDNSGMDGAIGPGQYIDLIHYDDTHSVSPDDESATNLRITLPFQKRSLHEEETKEGVRRQVRQNMVQ
jgi:hypothetical protein